MNDALAQLAQRLHQLFASGGRAHLVQQADGRYQAILRRLSVMRIAKMLRTGESIAAFQFSGKYTRWICLDFDLRRELVPTDGTAPDLSTVLEKTRQCARFLRHQKIPHLVEFSGNRGFHIWLLTAEKITRGQAHAFLKAIVEQSKISTHGSPVKIDFYPATPASASPRGQGVKIPLSKHVKSGGYSYIVEDIDSFEIRGSSRRQTLDPDFIAMQLKLLHSDVACKPGTVRATLGLSYSPTGDAVLRPAYVRAALKVADAALRPSFLEDILLALRQCECVDSILREIEAGNKPDEASRLILVGLFARMRSPDQPTLGIDLLTELFEKVPGYDASRTTEKLRNLSGLRPPTCEQIHNKLPHLRCTCEPDGHGVSSPVLHLIPLGIEIAREDPFTLELDHAHSLRMAQVRYSKENDEVPLHWTEQELLHLSDLQLSDLCDTHKLPHRIIERYYEFERIEPDGNRRKLYALSARDRTWTTAGMAVLNDLYHPCASENSYGYRLTPHFVGGRIFEPWLKQWQAFTSHLGELIYSPDCGDWQLLKIDIKRFYDRIDLERLRTRLLDGPTSALREHMRNLAPKERRQYQSIAKRLVEACKAMTGGDCGVPQGPAFARFLAEVYLLDFDAYVESLPEVSPDHYARYVDDIFIICPPDTDLAALESKVLHSLGTLGLTHSPEKHYRGTVRDYRVQFSTYWQDTKYFIDQVSRHYSSAPVDEVRRAAGDLYSLVDSGDGAEINHEHLNFLYTHLEHDASMSAMRARIEDYVLSLREGRGSFFHNFFKQYVKRLRQKHFRHTDKLHQISGLQRLCFFNVLLKSLAENPVEDPDALAQLRVLVDAVAGDVSTDLEIELAIALYLHDNRIASPDIIEKATDSTLLSLASSHFRKSIPSEAEPGLRDALLVHELPSFVNRLFCVLFHATTMRAQFAGKLLADFRNKALDAIREAEDAGTHLSMLDRDSVVFDREVCDRYYQLVCLSSVSMPAPPEPNPVLNAIWGDFIRFSNRMPERPPLSSRWMAKLADVRLDDTLLHIVFTRGIQGAVASPADNYETFLEFHQQLVLDQMGIHGMESESPSGIAGTDVATRVRAAVEENPKKWPLLSWVFSKTPAPVYAPSRDECMENIAKNGITVLRQGGELLVRRPTDPGPAKAFDYLPTYTTTSDQLQDGRFTCDTFTLPPDGYIKVDDRLHDTLSLLELIGRAIELRSRAEEFGNLYRPNGTEHMPNIFSSEAVVERTNLSPGLPQLILGERLVVFHEGSISELENNRKSFDAALYKKIISSRHSLLGTSNHLADVVASDLDTGLLGSFKDASEKLAFLELLQAHWQRLPAERRSDAFAVELCKAAAIEQLVMLSPAPERAASDAFFSTYLGLRVGQRPHFQYQLLLSMHGDIDLSDLSSTYATVRSSVAKFWEELGPCGWFLVVTEWLDNDLRRLSGMLSRLSSETGTELTPEDLRPTDVQVDRHRGGLRVEGTLVQDADPTPEQISCCHVTDLTRTHDTFLRLDAGRHQTLENAGKRLFYASRGGHHVFVLLSRSVFKAATVVQERQRELKRLQESPAKECLRIACYKNPGPAMARIRSNFGFNQAATVVAANDPDISAAEAREHLQQWLIHIPEEHRELLLRVIAAHEPVTQADEDVFVESLSNLPHETLLFSLTSAADLGGWHRILTRRDPALARRCIKRAEDVEKSAMRLGSIEAGGEIALVTDTIISGRQILWALRKHYFDSNADAKFVAKRNLIDLKNKAQFRRNLTSCSHLRVITAIHSYEGREHLLQPDNLPQLFQLAASSISFEGRTVGKGRSFLHGSALESRDQEMFKGIMGDLDFVSKTFLLDGAEAMRFYKSSVSDDGTNAAKVNSTNLITRRGSLPKCAARIFRMKLRSGYRSLFRYVGEAEDKE